MHRPLATVLLLTALVVPATARARNVSRFGVNIISCVVNSNGGNLTNGVNLVYYNTHDSAATEVDFRVNYKGQHYLLIDKGTFTRGAQINHNLTNSLTGQPWYGPAPKLCRVERVYLANGTALY